MVASRETNHPHLVIQVTYCSLTSLRGESLSNPIHSILKFAAGPDCFKYKYESRINNTASFWAECERDVEFEVYWNHGYGEVESGRLSSSRGKRDVLSEFVDTGVFKI